MKSISVTEFKSHCLPMLEESRTTGESIQILKRGKPLATVIPASTKVEYAPGKFKEFGEVVGDILVDGESLGIEWEALK
jgi:prevent-host-death family protein